MSIRRIVIQCLYSCFFALLASGKPSLTYAAIQFPKGLSQSDRIKALEIIGFGSSTKVLSNPYPLGGYQGLEVGFAVENLPSEDLGRLGQGLPSPQQDVTISKLSIGKGLYNNLDIFIHFTPYLRSDEIAQYGGLLRWGFYQGADFPVNLSLLAHANSANFSNQMSTQAYGADLIGGVNVDQLALFAGVGLVEAGGTFLGGASGITSSGFMETEFISSFHTIVGADIRIQSVFISLQIDRYKLPVFSGKLGLRF